MSKHLIYTTDNHLRDKKPIKRKDEYLVSQFTKFEAVLKHAQNKDAGVVCAGDLFDVPEFSEKRMSILIDILNKYDVEIFAVFGQHDVKNHNMKYWKESPLGILILTDYVSLLTHKPTKYKGYHLYGCSWNEEICIPKTKKNILVIHDLIVKEDPLFEGQENFEYAEDLILDFPEYDFFLCGDNHARFSKKTSKQLLLNAGSMMRNRKDQITHIPAFGEINLTTGKYKWIKYPQKAAEDVFNIEQLEREKEIEKEKKDFSELVSKIKNKRDRHDFKKTLNNIMKKSKVTVEIKNTVSALIKEVERGK